MNKNFKQFGIYTKDSVKIIIEINDYHKYIAGLEIHKKILSLADLTNFNINKILKDDKTVFLPGNTFVEVMSDKMAIDEYAYLGQVEEELENKLLQKFQELINKY